MATFTLPKNSVVSKKGKHHSANDERARHQPVLVDQRAQRRRHVDVGRHRVARGAVQPRRLNVRAGGANAGDLRGEQPVELVVGAERLARHAAVRSHHQEGARVEAVLLGAQAAEQHQLCWAHVIRGLREIAERPGDAGRLGRRLLRLAQTVFRVRHRFERAELAEPRYLRRMQQLRRRLQAALSLGAQLPWSRYAGRCQHLLAHEARLWTFLRAPDIPLTNNAAERALRGIAVGRHNWTFAGSDAGGRRAAAIYTLIETAKLNDVDPQAWLADVLARIADTPQNRLADLLPWNWRRSTVAAKAA